MKAIGKIILGAAFFSGTFILVYSAGNAIRERPGFCLSCHLPDGSDLHRAKGKAFAEGKDLAGLHKKKKDQFNCTHCHSGLSLKMKGAITAAEAKNMAAYLLLRIEEPKKMDPASMPDENCETCHVRYKGGEFHGVKAHQPKVKFQCISCHSGHSAGDPAYFFIVEDQLFSVCVKCHPHIPQPFNRAGRMVTRN